MQTHSTVASEVPAHFSLLSEGPRGDTSNLSLGFLGTLFLIIDHTSEKLRRGMRPTKVTRTNFRLDLRRTLRDSRRQTQAQQPQTTLFTTFKITLKAHTALITKSLGGVMQCVDPFGRFSPTAAEKNLPQTLLLPTLPTARQTTPTCKATASDFSH